MPNSLKEVNPDIIISSYMFELKRINCVSFTTFNVQ